jgi:hypothetical protein
VPIVWVLWRDVFDQIMPGDGDEVVTILGLPVLVCLAWIGVDWSKARYA